MIQARSAWTAEQWEQQDGSEVIAGVEILQEMILWMIKQYDDSLPWEEHVLREEMNRWLPVQRSRSVIWQYGMWTVLLLFYRGSLYFLLAKAAIRRYSWQIAFF